MFVESYKLDNNLVRFGLNGVESQIKWCKLTGNFLKISPSWIDFPGAWESIFDMPASLNAPEEFYLHSLYTLRQRESSGCIYI